MQKTPVWLYSLPKDVFSDLFENPNTRNFAYTLDKSKVDEEDVSPDIMQLSPMYVTLD